MRVIKISEISSLENKENIPSVQGTLVRAFDRKEGDGAHGPYSVQNGTLKDASGEMKVVIWNHPDAKQWLNREILIESVSGDKGITGVYVEDSSWTDKKTGEPCQARQIKVTATAAIVVVNGKAPKASGAEEAARAALPKAQESYPEHPSDPVASFKRAMAPKLNAFYLIERGVREQVEQAKIDGIECSVENFGGKCAAVFRSLSPSLIDDLPIKPLWGAEKQLEKPYEGLPEDEF